MAIQCPVDTRPNPTAMSGTLNWLRAGVLGANDGIVSVAGFGGGESRPQTVNADLCSRPVPQALSPGRCRWHWGNTLW